SIEGHEGYITVGLFEDNTPGELFVTMAKEGSTLSGMMDAFATSVSLLFQYGVPLSHLVEKFGHMRFEPAGWTGNPEIGFAKSIVDYVFRWLGNRFLSQEERAALGLIRTTEVADVGPQLELLNRVVELAAPDAPATANGNGHTSPETPAAPAYRRLNSTPDAPPSPRGGWLTVRSGTCHKCENCGETTGCSSHTSPGPGRPARRPVCLTARHSLLPWGAGPSFSPTFTFGAPAHICRRAHIGNESNGVVVGYTLRSTCPDGNQSLPIGTSLTLDT